LTFSEELHAIDAVIAGQGVGLFSDVLVAHELATGELVRLLDLALPGFGFYFAHIPDHPRQTIIDAFAAWIRSVGRDRYPLRHRAAILTSRQNRPSTGARD
jgi:LysR family glycine cleavage system transcriptional activator